MVESGSVIWAVGSVGDYNPSASSQPPACPLSRSIINIVLLLSPEPYSLVPSHQNYLQTLGMGLLAAASVPLTHPTRHI
jgi:hypothetical protein